MPLAVVIILHSHADISGFVNLNMYLKLLYARIHFFETYISSEIFYAVVSPGKKHVNRIYLHILQHKRLLR